MRFSRRLGLAVIGALFVCALMVAAGSASQPKFSASAAQISVDSTYVAQKSTSGALAQTDPALLGRTDSTPVNVMIKYDYDATASYTGGVAGLAATSPSVTGKKLKDNPAAVSAYEQHTSQVSTKITAAV